MSCLDAWLQEARRLGRKARELKMRADNTGNERKRRLCLAQREVLGARADCLLEMVREELRR